MSSNYPYDPYASAMDPAYDPNAGPSWDAVYQQLIGMGYSDAQLRTMTKQQAQLAAAVNGTQTSGGGSGGSGYSGGAAAPTWAQLEAQRQWTENFGYNKAVHDQQQQLAQAQFAYQQQHDAQTRQDNLHGPQDYIKYWTASRNRPDQQAAPAWTQPQTTIDNGPMVNNGLTTVPQKANPQNLSGIPIYTPGGQEYYSDPRVAEKGRLVR